ncbi:MAG: hypothetical protein AB1642_13440 [Pseudomonadota bacterium]
MADIPENTAALDGAGNWLEGIYQLEQEDLVLGGAEGIDNLQAKQLLARINWLKGQLPALGITAFILTLLDDVDAAAARATLGAVAQADIDTAIANLVNSSPAALDTLNELAAALGNDANFAATITAALALKAPLASPAFTDTPTAPTADPGTNTGQLATTEFVTAALAVLAAASITPPSLQDFRLSLQNGVPVTTADIAGAGTLYCVPYKGNHIALYDGAKWVVRQSAQFSLALAGLTAGKPYDVFVYDNAGVPTLDLGAAWTSDTVRAEGLALLNGVYVKDGAPTRRYLGTFYATGAATTEDSEQNRYLWNYYHRVRKIIRKRESDVSSWTQANGAWRYANADNTNCVNFVRGLNEDIVSAEATAVFNTNTTGNSGAISVTLDGSLVPDLSYVRGGMIETPVSLKNYTLRALYSAPVGVGKHELSWIEYAPASGTNTWLAAPLSAVGTGISGEVWA